MKKYVIIVSALFTALLSNAQVNDIPIIGNKFTFGIDGGGSLPSSDFASTSLTSSNTTIHGFAKTGFYYDAYAGFHFSKLMGIMVQYGANKNSFNSTDLGGNFSANGGYTVNEYLVGLYLTFHASKIKVEAKALGGLISSNYPSISDAAGDVIASFQTGNGFGYCIGAKVKYMMLAGVLGIGVGINYVGSDISFTGVDPQSGGNSSYTSKMNIGIIQPTLGLSIDI